MAPARATVAPHARKPAFSCGQPGWQHSRQLRRPSFSSGSSGSSGARRAGALRTCAFMHKDEQLQRTVDKYVAAINAHDIAALCAVLAPKVVWSDRVWSRDDLLGHKKIESVHQKLFEAYPDYHMHIEDVLARGDANTVAVHFTATGTNTGVWRGSEPSGKRTIFSGVTLFIFDSESDDQIKQVITYRQPTERERHFYLKHEE
ncbi:hypothetical protein COHA_003479 [Chlorella ohadii]|uniref:SnoaL-like domain-containing protein n=1 Tax=Chlorella ohadii TaxID=2649997 RepID=A0AAD5DTG3_9CHLO|nr:hypothetical protein COHA_003479 [Chlorella ohadii]